MAKMAADDHRYQYSVAWIDLLARGRHLGRSVLTRGNHAPAASLCRRSADHPLDYEPKVWLRAPAATPGQLLNRASVGAFNEAWYRKAPRLRRDELLPLDTFFHPLDRVDAWNHLYREQGFLQHQLVLPFGAEATLRAVVERIADAGATSFLAVLKRFGSANPAPLSFPRPGWTLALDLPAIGPDLGALLDRLDELVVRAGGRVYLAKDSRLRPELLEAMYPALPAWRAVRDRVDPERRLSSDLARRLPGLLDPAASGASP